MVSVSDHFATLRNQGLISTLEHLERKTIMFLQISLTVIRNFLEIYVDERGQVKTTSHVIRDLHKLI